MNDAELFVRYGVVVVCLLVLLFHVLCFSCSSQQQQTPTKSLVIQYVTLFRQVIFAGLLPIRPVRRHLDYRKRHVAYSVQIPAEELSPKKPKMMIPMLARRTSETPKATILGTCELAMAEQLSWPKPVATQTNHSVTHGALGSGERFFNLSS